jgi:hypothetical protein
VKQFIGSVLLCVCVLVLSSCIEEATPSPIAGVVVKDQASFLAALQATGAAVTVDEPIVQTFFTPEGQIIKVNGQDVQVFEYESNEAMEAEALQVNPSGGTIRDEMIMWTDLPHFYKAGRIIALYIGTDEELIGLLEKVLGLEFAGAGT